MVKRVSLWDAACPVARALDVIGDWWSLLIIRERLRRRATFQRIPGRPWHFQGGCLQRGCET